MATYDELPKKAQIKPPIPTRDILMDGNGIWCEIVKGPFKDKDSSGKEITYAIVDAPIGKEFRYFYPNIPPMPNQMPEYFRIEAPSIYWKQANDDQFAGAYFLIIAFDGSEDTVLFKMHDILLKAMEELQEKKYILELEIFTLREQNFNLTGRALDEIKRYGQAYKEMIELPIYKPGAEQSG